VTAGMLMGKAAHGAAGLLHRTLPRLRLVAPPWLRGAVQPLRRRRRAAEAAQQSRLRAREADLRSSIEAAPTGADAWWELAQTLDGQRRHDEAIDARLRAAELGGYLRRALVQFRNRPVLRERVRAARYMNRVRALADANPQSVQAQLQVGSFFLDQEERETGRSIIRRGYRLRSPGLYPPPMEGTPDETPSLEPSFLVLGPHKSGTTSLHAWMLRHPRVLGASRKELWFWSRESRKRSLETYRAYFPPQPVETGYITGEATPTYLMLRQAAAEVATAFPRMKAIVLHRDPVARAYSHYQMMVRLQAETRPFEQAIDDELLALGPRPPLTMDGVPAKPGTRPYLLESCILPFLAMWSDALGAGRVMVVETTELASRSQSTLNAVVEYLGLASHTLPELTNRNAHPYDPIAPELRARLERWFAPHEEALDAFLASHPAYIAEA
jgi:hypothetical protein